jgi:hypothetical protein
MTGLAAHRPPARPPAPPLSAGLCLECDLHLLFLVTPLPQGEALDNKHWGRCVWSRGGRCSQRPAAPPPTSPPRGELKRALTPLPLPARQVGQHDQLLRPQLPRGPRDGAHRRQGVRRPRASRPPPLPLFDTEEAPPALLNPLRWPPHSRPCHRTCSSPPPPQRLCRAHALHAAAAAHAARLRRQPRAPHALLDDAGAVRPHPGGRRTGGRNGGRDRGPAPAAARECRGRQEPRSLCLAGPSAAFKTFVPGPHMLIRSLGARLPPRRRPTPRRWRSAS